MEEILTSLEESEAFRKSQVKAGVAADVANKAQFDLFLQKLKCSKKITLKDATTISEHLQVFPHWTHEQRMEVSQTLVALQSKKKMLAGRIRRRPLSSCISQARKCLASNLVPFPRNTNARSSPQGQKR